MCLVWCVMCVLSVECGMYVKCAMCVLSCVSCHVRHVMLAVMCVMLCVSVWCGIWVRVETTELQLHHST